MKRPPMERRNQSDTLSIAFYPVFIIQYFIHVAVFNLTIYITLHYSDGSAILETYKACKRREQRV